MNRPAKRDLAYLRSAAINPTGRVFISPFTDVYRKARDHGWLVPTGFSCVAKITAAGRAAIQAVEEME